MKLCFCNGCDNLLEDMNPQTGAKEFPEILVSALTMIKDEQGDGWCCPYCKTDGYLMDIELRHIEAANNITVDQKKLLSASLVDNTVKTDAEDTGIQITSFTTVHPQDTQPITGFEVRPFKIYKEDGEEDESVTSLGVTDAEADGFGIYANLQDGTQQWVADCPTREMAEPMAASLLNICQRFENWICTDPDTQQYGRKVYDGMWLFKEQYKPESLIVIKEYSPVDVESTLNSYGYTMYNTMDGLHNINELYGDSAEQIIAECLFETYI